MIDISEYTVSDSFFDTQVMFKATASYFTNKGPSLAMSFATITDLQIDWLVINDPDVSTALVNQGSRYYWQECNGPERFGKFHDAH